MKIYYDQVHQIHIDLEAITAITQLPSPEEPYEFDHLYLPYRVYLKLHDSPLVLSTERWYKLHTDIPTEKELEHREEHKRLLEAWKALQ